MTATSPESESPPSAMSRAWQRLGRAFAFLGNPWVRVPAGYLGVILFVLTCLGLGLWLRWFIWPTWIQALPMGPDGEEIWAIDFIDPDDYTRLDRVRRILDGEQGWVIKRHSWENWPEGMQPSTTAPLDWCVLALYFICRGWCAVPLDWAGAIVGPCLYVVLLLYLTWWTRGVFALWPRFFLLFAVSVMTGPAYATTFAHPDHQSLLLLLLTCAMSAEWKRWGGEETATASNPETDSHGWSIFAGSCWGLALWVSFFEPTILLLATLLLTLVTRRREQIPFLATLAVWLVLIASVEGFHAISTELLRYSDVLYRWGVTIAELRSLNFTTYCLYLTPAALLFPFLVVRCFILREATSVWARLTAIQWYVVAIAVLTVGLAIWQQRWFPYASMALIFFFAMWLSMETGWVWRTAFTLFFLYGTATATEAALRAQSTPLVGEVMQITRTIAAIRAQDGAPQPFKLGVPLLAQRRAPADFRGIVAPWWASPMLLYRTRQPIVASSSHSSISGILDSAAFFCAASWGEADEILVRRKARWIVVYDPQLVLPELYKVLYGTDRNLWPPMDQALVGNALWNATGVQPSRFKLRSILRNTRVYEYLGPPPPLPEPARPATGDDVQKDTKAPPKWDPNTRMPDVPEMPPLPPVPEEPATNDMR